MVGDAANAATSAAVGSLASLEISTEEVQQTMARGGRLGREQFYEALNKDLRRVLRDLEAAAALHQESSEDLMTAWIVSSLKGAGYKAAHDEYERGHADIKVESDRLDLKWLAEAKIHSAYEYALDGMKQLVTRYASGRDPRGGFFLYVFKRKASLPASCVAGRVRGQHSGRRSALGGRRLALSRRCEA